MFMNSCYTLTLLNIKHVSECINDCTALQVADGKVEGRNTEGHSGWRDEIVKVER